MTAWPGRIPWQLFYLEGIFALNPMLSGSIVLWNYITLVVLNLNSKDICKRVLGFVLTNISALNIIPQISLLI